jgi:hypothetical protein
MSVLKVSFSPRIRTRSRFFVRARIVFIKPVKPMDKRLLFFARGINILYALFFIPLSFFSGRNQR